jgi:ATP/maltotriose-dependent transcriptional regulator MalT
MLEQHGGLLGARHLLRDLERRGEMLSVLQSGETYRLHPLMREAMLDRVRERDGDDGVARLHAWAGGMFEASGRHAPALFHLERARDETRLMNFLNAHVDALFADGHGEQAAKAVRELTKRGTDAPVLVGRVQGMLLRQRGQPGAR